MEIAVTSEEMRACDRFAIRELGISPVVLMENAGRSAVEMMAQHFSPLTDKSVYIFCGKGNNGGDGLVVARHLLNYGCHVNVFLLGKSNDYKNESKTSLQIIKALIKKQRADNRLRLVESVTPKKLNVLRKPDIIVDALFGTGFSGEVRGIYKRLIEYINMSGAKKISIDLPSGLNADTGEVLNAAVKADVTSTMCFSKTGLFICNGRNYAGKIEVIDIGIPRFILHKKFHLGTNIINENDVKRVLPIRSLRSHKHSVGKVLVVSGSRGMTGAAAMTAETAMKAGAGTAVLCAPNSLYPILARKLTEVMVEPHPETSDGSLDMAAYESIEKHFTWADILIIGPGLSRNRETSKLILKIISEFQKPMVIDADALNALSDYPLALKKRKGSQIIITPHAGELSRLIKTSPEKIESNRIKFAKETARKFNLDVILKGAPTITACADGKVFINSTGNPGMATAGSGDVLAGLLGGLWAQGMSTADAAYAAVYVHGLAGDLAKEKYGEKSLMATDIQQYISKALQKVESS